MNKINKIYMYVQVQMAFFRMRGFSSLRKYRIAWWSMKHEDAKKKRSKYVLIPTDVYKTDYERKLVLCILLI